MAGGDGMSGTGTWTVPSPVVAVGNSGDGVVGGVVVSSVVVVVVVVVVSSSPASSPQDASKEATAIPEASVSSVECEAPREVMKGRLTAPDRG
jgi:hypothetical protein